MCVCVCVDVDVYPPLIYLLQPPTPTRTHTHTPTHTLTHSVSYFVSGSGGQDVYDADPAHPQAKLAVMESGFMAHTFVEGGKKMKVEIVGRDGEVLLTTVLEQRRTRTQAQTQAWGAVAEVKHP